MYEYYDNKRLNIGKLIFIAIILLIIISLAIFLTFRSTLNKKDDTENKTDNLETFCSNDNSISVELSTNLNLEKYDSNYLLELRSKDNLDIFISKKDILINRELSDIIKADKIAFLQKFDTNSNLSDIKEISVNDNLAYTYSFHYLDKTLNTAFYLQIVWLQVGEHYYVFDVEFPLDQLNFYTNLVSSVLLSFKENIEKPEVETF